MKTRIAGVLVAAAVMACGGSTDSGGEDAGGGGGGGATTMECYGESNGCQTASQYCLLSKSSSGITLAGMCANLPSNCTTCDCADGNTQSEWSRVNPGTDNCTGAVITCSQSDREITVTCKK